MRMLLENDYRFNFSNNTVNYYPHTMTLANCQKNPQQAPYVVNTNEVWEKAIVLDQDLIVKTGATLTIRCRLNMPEHGKITVEPGAKLVVDEGTITNACGYVWQGIELYGNSSVAQTLSGGYYPQAHLVLKNGAVIENARNAVTTWKFNDYAKTGGIITASDAIFRNNHRSVEFISYPFAEKSTFKNCTFIIDGPLNDGGYCTNMVTAWNVNGTSFQGCTFEFTYTGLYGTAPLPKGIYTHNANFRVIPLCTAPPGGIFPCPPSQQQPNYFKGLYYGIHATNGTSFPYRVDSAHFENCAYGIYSDRVNNFQVTRSTFNINPFYVTGTATGMENNCGTGFKIEGNRFYSTHAQAQNYLLMGLMNVNTGPALNEVYRNKYENLRIANNSALTNWSWGGGNTDQGLKYKCNTHTGNRRDLMVVNGTVGQNQGSVIDLGNGNFSFNPAGNTFSVTTDPLGHIANFGQNLIRYVHHNPASTPLIVQPTNIMLNNVTLQFSNEPLNSGSCPSKLGKQITVSKTEFFSAKSNYDDVRYVYDNLLNGGNTQSTLQQVENSWPAQAWELRNQLLAKSPFLGMEVLYGVAERTDVLPHALMLEVFMANPHCAKDRRFLAYLENKPVPMPVWMISLLAGNTARTLKDDLEAAMSQQAVVWATAADEIIHHYLSDETDYSPDSALAWVNRKTTYVAKLQKSDLSAANTAYGDALADIQLIRDSFVKLPDELTADLNSREDLYTLLAGFGQDYWALDTAAQLTLLNFALSGKMAGHTEAANILRFFYGYAIDHTLFAEEPEPKSIKNSTTGNTHHDALLMKVYPNPGNEYVVFEYILPDLPPLGNEFWAEILDLEGRVLFSESLNGTKGVKTIDVSGFKSGAYLYRLSGKTGTLESGTLIIK
ncbi:MAG: T9SS type A sorting domain-containing protein [Flavobacteriales bacterium]|nr:T9SS type A sorting domain-containing protein [Flavobacteriales bacterium]